LGKFLLQGGKKLHMK